ncbi:MAG TPA: carboxypeptidase regulatory-like domain-containing protein, partial [Vicinamibacterales bacterium]|nr:carboxypeptidase regulatory-like domain-containing protein [Vicinamibacterales bacterium]
MEQMKRMIVLLAAWALCGVAATAFAQGVQTGTIRGVVKDQQGLATPGVTVTVTSPALQGPRSVVTDTQGLYSIPALPAGTYTVRFELSGFTAIERKTDVALGLTVDQSVTMRPAGVAETVNVVAETPAPIATPVVGANYKHEEIEALATPRTIQGIAQLAPALTTNSPNGTQLVINGGFAYDNIFMINGVDVNDNLFATPQNLFVEDAIAETQVLTSGISAEYGRFSGGVVNAVTKSGSNRFEGSGRVNMTNPAWSSATPFEVAQNRAATAHPNQNLRSYEGVFGGPLLKDHIWFFTSGRYTSNSAPVTLPVSAVVVDQETNNKRGSLKFTGSPVAGHTLQGEFFNNPQTTTNASGLSLSFLIDPHVLIDRSNPNKSFFLKYSGVLKNSLLAEAQYSQRGYTFNQSGPSGSSILDSPFFDINQTANYNAPYFDTNDPEERNNRQLTGNITGYWTLKGRHETKTGYEWFRSQRTGGNSQSPTSYVFLADFVTNAAGAPVLDSTGRPIPQFVPGESLLQFFPAVKNAVLNVDNNSIFVQDHWIVNDRLSADIGARYEHVKALSTGDIESINSNRIVPRLGLSYSLQDNGDQVIHATYAQYSGRYNEAQIAANSPVGNPAFIQSAYQGPAGQGYAFTPGVTIANYPISSSNSIASDPLQNVFMTPGMKSPLVHEFTTSFGSNLVHGKGFGEVSYVYRKTTNLIEDFATVAGGFTEVIVQGVDTGKFTNVIYDNTDQAHRQYQGMVFQGRYTISSNWTAYGQYTLQLKNEGNYEGEGTNTPGSTSQIGNYPEIFNAARSYPDGRLQDFQRSRINAWTVYNWRMGAAGDLSFSGLWNYNSARVYSLVARNQGITAIQNGILESAGYPDSPGVQTVYFGNRGSEEFAGYGIVNTSVNYNVPVFKSLRPWLKLDVFNLFNNLKLIA